MGAWSRCPFEECTETRTPFSGAFALKGLLFSDPPSEAPSSGHLDNKDTSPLFGELHTLLRFSRPPMTLSVAASKSTMLTSSLPPRAAMRAASLHTLAMSAPAHGAYSLHNPTSPSSGSFHKVA